MKLNKSGRLLSLVTVLMLVVCMTLAFAITASASVAEVNPEYDAHYNECGKVRVTWDKVPSASMYIVYFDGEHLAYTTRTAYSIADLTVGESHTFRIDAVDADDKIIATGSVDITAEHEYASVVTDPTCTEGGYTTHTCDCGDTYVDSELPALGHTYGSVVTDPTCTEGGYTTHTCSVCGHSYVDSELSANGHSYSSVVTPPTCTEDGYTTYTCSVCSHTYKADYVDALNHNYSAWVSNNNGTHTKTCANDNGHTVTESCHGGTATCTAKAICSDCGTAYGDVLPHSYSSVVTPPTCTEGGYTTYTCSCGDTYVADETPATGHDYDAVVTPPTCTEGGYTTYTCSCGDTYVDDETPAAGHSYEAVVTNPTCTTGGYTTHTCSVCGDSYVDSEVAATGHSYEAVVTNPTCTTGGYTTHTCSVCGDSYVDSEVTATGHSYEAVVTNPTCTTGGYTTHTCSVCGDSYTDSDVPATGHSYSSVVTNPTCTEGGYTTHTCSVCGDSYTDNETTATGHSYTTSVTAPTCTDGGYTTYTCSSCSDSFTDNETPATGHVGGTATCSSRAICTVCGNAYGDTLGHNFPSEPSDEYVETIAPTCDENGAVKVYCHNGCGANTATTIPALGHDLTTIPEAPATCTSNGVSAYDVCNVCGKEFGKTELSATPHDYEWVTDETDESFTAIYEREICKACGHENQSKLVKVNVSEEHKTLLVKAGVVLLALIIVISAIRALKAPATTTPWYRRRRRR